MKATCTTLVLRHRQEGVTAVEFALISIFFFTLVLGIIELGRLMYVWNTVQEVTRRAAREAVVRTFSSAEQDALRREAVFRAGNGTGTVYLPFGPELSNALVQLSYLYDTDPSHVVTSMPAGPKENLVACADAALTQSCIRYVRAEVCTAADCGGILYRPMIGFLPGFRSVQMFIPFSPVVMPAEGLGFDPSS